MTQKFVPRWRPPEEIDGDLTDDEVAWLNDCFQRMSETGFFSDTRTYETIPEAHSSYRCIVSVMIDGDKLVGVCVYGPPPKVGVKWAVGSW